MKKKILLSLAHMGGNEQKYIQEAFDTNWVVPLGPNVDAFENDLARYIGNDRYVIALSAGTAAVHLALVQLGVKTGDEVICQSFTFAASCNPITYQGAIPVLVDSEEDTWNMSPIYLEEAIIDRKKVTGRYPKAIILVHLYGIPSKIDEIMAIARKYNIPVIEDAAEALGSTYKDEMCGTFGDFGVLSFNGNKIITTSGGGALICSTEEEKKSTMFYATQARENREYYYHEKIGYNYRMSNICAGIGRGQMEVLRQHVDRRREIHSLYRGLLKNVKGVVLKESPDDSFQPNYWLSCITIDQSITGKTPSEIMYGLATANIESRLLWRPMHMQPIYASNVFYGDHVSDRIFKTGLCLPSGSILTDEDIRYVVGVLKAMIA